MATCLPAWEVSAAMAPQGQPVHAAGQPNPIGSMVLMGQLPHPSAGFHGETHMEVEVEAAETHVGFPTASPHSPPALRDPMGTSLPGLPNLTGTWPSLM